jgi:hypothetical protein
MKILENLTINYILERIPQEAIMEYYIKIPVNINTLKGNSFKSPFRNDTNPTCNYYYNENGKLRIIDFGKKQRYDCFDVASIVSNINIKTSQGFMLLLNKIAYDFKIHKYSDNKNREDFKLIFKQNQEQKQIKTFKIVPRAWNPYDKKYWYDKFGIGSDLLRIGKVIPIDELWIEGKDGYLKRIYTYKTSNPGYAYFGGVLNGINIWKCYFPLSRMRSTKFYTNYNFIQGIELLVPSQIGIITKSWKDALVWKTLGLQAIAIPHENFIISANTFYKIRSYFDILITNFDYDRTGMLLSKEYIKQYGCLPMMLTNGKFNSYNYGAKDISGYRETFGESLTKRLVYNLYETHKEELDNFSNNLTKQLQWI